MKFVYAFVLLLVPVIASADIVIDFEGFDLDGQTFLDVGSPLEFANAGNSGVDVSFQQGADLRVYDLFSFGGDPNATGQALIDFPFPAGSNTAGTQILFSSEIIYFSLDAGDFGGDNDSPITIRAFDANDNILAIDSETWGASQFPPFITLEVTAPGIRRIEYKSGGSFAGSTFIDNVTFTAVPEPGSMAILALGLAGVMLRQRRRS